MSKLTVLILSLLVSTSAHASLTHYGSECGLTDNSYDDSWKDLSTVSYDITGSTMSEINRLPTLVKQQIIVGAKRLVDDPSGIRNTIDAVEALREASSDGVYLRSFKVGRRPFTELVTYPGDNPYAVIFRKGSTHVVAFINDSDVVCAF